MNRRTEAQLDMAFAAPVLATPTRAIRGMVRGTDAIESQRGAVRQVSTRTMLQRRILEILAIEGDQNVKQLEARAEFRDLGVCTVRKRVSELFHSEMIERAGREDGCAVWRVK